MASDFVHLHVHSDFSILDGACTIYQILESCQKHGMQACALTDHGNLFGAVEFYKAARNRGIKPIIGCELYVAPGSRFEKVADPSGVSNHHLLLLCENEEGYHNLCRLSTAGYLEGFYYKPRVDDELLERYHEGLIASTACLAGRVPKAILNDNLDAARAAIEKYISIFGKDHFVIELMDHGLEKEEKVNPVLAALAEEYGLMTIATNDCHYIEQDDAEAHEALLCVQTNSTLQDEKHFHFPNDRFYFRSPDEMRSVFARWPEAVRNTVELAERCNVEIPLGLSLIPKYDLPDERTKEEFLHDLVMEGLDERFPPSPPPAYLERAEYELKVINHMQFVAFFLVVWDLIKYARTQAIPVGPGRGSSAGSLVAYALRITNIDPMRYNLLFERFLNPDRISMPDFDIDFCPLRREELIRYARTKYGEENVGQIITFGRMLAKNVIRNVGRVLGMPYGDVDRIAKLIPEGLKVTLKTAREKEPVLRRLIEDDPQIAKLWRLATRLEGTIGSCGTHAAGVVICDHPLTDHVALFKAAGSETVATQVEVKGVEDMGLLKMDFLGLRNLTVIYDTVRLVKEKRGVDIDIDTMEPNDDKTYELLRSGHTYGVFQLESSGMRDLAKSIGLQSLEEMSALVALYRPGPMENIPAYVEHKFNAESVVYHHPCLEPILKETYGIPIYQEQVMQMVQALAGFSLGEADILRRAMGKKKAELMAKQRDRFVEGCVANGIDEQLAAKLFSTIETFAEYGFNKSHSMAYALVAYQTAYLKTHYPVEFMCALLTSESNNLDKIALYVQECRRMSINVLPPDINKSEEFFSVEGDAIRFGMTAIKNLGEGPAEAIVKDRQADGDYDDIFDLCGRLEPRLVNKRLLESLNKAGAFASTGWNRAQVEAVIENAISEGQIAYRERASGQTSLFDLGGMEDAARMLHTKPGLSEWPEPALLQYEKEVLGLYVSGHPLARHAETLERFNTMSPLDLDDLRNDEMVNIGGIVANVRLHHASRGKMAFVTLETSEGRCEITVFHELFSQKESIIVQDAILMFAARVNYRNNEPGLVAENVLPIEDAEQYLTKAIHIRIPADRLDNGIPESLARILGEARGPCDVYLHCVMAERGEVTIHAADACRVAPSRTLRLAIEELLGKDSVFLSAGMGLPSHQNLPPPPEQPFWKRNKANGRNG